MNPLLEKLNNYYEILNYKFQYELSDGTIIDFKLNKASFPHLIGLHKLIDLPIIASFNDKSNIKVKTNYIIQRITREEVLTDSFIRTSINFPSIENRYNTFCKETILAITYTDVVIDFNPKIMNSKLNAKYILFNKDKIQYNHLAIGEEKNKKFYVESFFSENTDKYIKNQKIEKVSKVTIFDNNGKLYLEDTF